MLRTTWEKTSNPYIRFATRGDRPRIGINRRLHLPRPKGSTYTFVYTVHCFANRILSRFLCHRKPITAWLYFSGTEAELAQAKDLTFDVPGGGFICMSPEHHEERIIRWAIKTKRPVLSFDYGKVSLSPSLSSLCTDNTNRNRHLNIHSPLPLMKLMMLINFWSKLKVNVSE